MTKLINRGFYGKVARQLIDKWQVEIVYFTSVPAEIDFSFHVFQQILLKTGEVKTFHEKIRKCSMSEIGFVVHLTNFTGQECSRFK